MSHLLKLPWWCKVAEGLVPLTLWDYTMAGGHQHSQYTQSIWMISLNGASITPISPMTSSSNAKSLPQNTGTIIGTAMPSLECAVYLCAHIQNEGSGVTCAVRSLGCSMTTTPSSTPITIFHLCPQFLAICSGPRFSPAAPAEKELDGDRQPPPRWFGHPGYGQAAMAGLNFSTPQDLAWIIGVSPLIQISAMNGCTVVSMIRQGTE